MPGYVIHLAVAERYLEKHPNKSENYEDFIEGVIFPDGVKDKSKTHYGNGSSNSNLPDFLNEHNLENSFDRGYFIHLLTDYLFYNKYIDTFSKEIYNDYDILNKELITKYHITLPDKAKKDNNSKESKTEQPKKAKLNKIPKTSAENLEKTPMRKIKEDEAMQELEDMFEEEYEYDDE